MLDDARPLALDVPGAFADPLGLVAQGAPGTLAAVVVRYGTAGPDAGEADYDVLVAASGAPVAAARLTPALRAPVMPARVLRRFADARAAGEGVALSLFALDEQGARALLAALLLAPCLKLAVRGAASAPLVADQLAAAACRRGLLELGDFSDPARPRLRFLDVSADAPPSEVALAAFLGATSGRLLLYDADRNAALAADRDGGPPDPAAVLAQAARLVAAREATAPPVPPPDLARRPRPSDDADEAAALAAHAPPTPAPAAPPGAATLATLLRDAPPGADPLADLLGALGAPGTAPPASPACPSATPAPVEPEERRPEAPPVPPDHPPDPAPLPDESAAVLGADLAAAVAAVTHRLRDVLGDRTFDELDAHVHASSDPAADPVGYLTALLVGPPPRRRLGFHGHRRRAYPAAADALHAVFRAHRGLAHPALDAIPALWARLHA